LFIASKAVTSVSYIHFESAAGEYSGTKNIPQLADLAFSQSVCKKHHALVIKNGNYRALFPSHDFLSGKTEKF
jgi:hypothetical protein